MQADAAISGTEMEVAMAMHEDPGVPATAYRCDPVPSYCSRIAVALRSHAKSFSDELRKRLVTVVLGMVAIVVARFVVSFLWPVNCASPLSLYAWLAISIDGVWLMVATLRRRLRVDLALVSVIVALDGIVWHAAGLSWLWSDRDDQVDGLPSCWKAAPTLYAASTVCAAGSIVIILVVELQMLMRRVLYGSRRLPCQKSTPPALEAQAYGLALTVDVVPPVCCAPFGEEFCCPICLEDLLPEDGEAIHLLTQCGHSYHNQCWDQWLDVKRQCPLCRFEVP